ncbi:2OG-Fe(II) oxygenase [Kitasatospora sp. NPDC092286]|uniref:2OG-Fe(II) oxygenase n=1 Tax=Kitasatospora sp. NPDC092286 TaxID=3364087 RepID=UPI003807031A
MNSSLDEILDGRRWRLREYPFRHLWAEPVFRRTRYEQMALELRQLLAVDGTDGFQRNMRGYDATGHSFRPGYRGAFEAFLSSEFRDALSRVFDVPVTCDVNASLHHHEAGAASGQVHNDLNPGWFVARPHPDGVNLADSGRCSYRYGTTSEPGLETVERVRAVAVLYYLDNGPWFPGRGGETGLYLDRTTAVTEPTVLVPPTDNGMLAFECTPTSFHTYLASTTQRNSLVLWLHRSKEDAVARWTDREIVRWARASGR